MINSFPTTASTRRKSLRILPYISLIISTLSFTGCNVFDREEDIPAYLFIDNFQLETKSDNSQGSNDHDILDAWVYVDGQLIGAFEVPVTVPILVADTARVTVLAGVKNNGRANNRVIYPFYRAVQDTMILKPGGMDSIFPVIEYHDSTVFEWIEDFEDRTISMEPSGLDVEEDSIRLTLDPNEVFNHHAKSLVSGYVEFDSANQKFENSTISKFTVPRNSSAYLEMNYNLETNTQVGFYVFDASGIQIDRIPVLVLFPTDGEWKKSYISFNEDMSNPDYANATFKVFFEAYGPETGGRIYVDNLKLVHF
jgi:hypothetical protein